ncbi:MAG: L-histidine N(alpha)-methyltransferase [Pseudomonadota bacterium]
MDGSQPAVATSIELAADALYGLGQQPKALKPKWLYDARGSTLFEEITQLPEYYLTRVETSILRENAEGLAAYIPHDGVLFELGAGASVKTRILLDAVRGPMTYAPFDISETFLQETAEALRRYYPHIRIEPIVGDFFMNPPWPSDLLNSPKTVFFPGSTIGNLPPDEADALLARARNWPNVERFILGLDCVKDVDRMVAAYDDNQGVTAQFISNILSRLNTEACADFDLDAFDYRASWNEEKSQIEMRLIANKPVSVLLDGHDVAFERGEPILVSTSRKFTPEVLAAMASNAGWRVETSFQDAGNEFLLAVLARA